MSSLSKFDEDVVAALRIHIAKLWDEQRRQFFKSPDMLFKLKNHFPTVSCAARLLAPEDTVLRLAADYHDYGRAPQYTRFGNFNDGKFGSRRDHHEIGYQEFLDETARIVKDQGFSQEEYIICRRSGVIYQVSQAIRLHGLRGYAFEAEFQRLDARTAEIVDTVSLLDDLANGVQCAHYLLREAYGQTKNQSKGGFIPDENAELKTASPSVLEAFLGNQNFDRNKECQTYADYCLYQMSLLARCLADPQTHSVAKQLVLEPVRLQYHGLDADMKSYFFQKNFPNGIDALDFVCSTLMTPELATEAIHHLRGLLEPNEP